MKKTLIVLLAVCLVSAHAFVRRDAPQQPSQDLVNQVQELGKKSFEEIQKALDPELIKKHFSEFVDQVDKALEGFKPKKEEPPK